MMLDRSAAECLLGLAPPYTVSEVEVAYAKALDCARARAKMSLVDRDRLSQSLQAVEEAKKVCLMACQGSPSPGSHSPFRGTSSASHYSPGGAPPFQSVPVTPRPPVQVPSRTQQVSTYKPAPTTQTFVQGYSGTPVPAPPPKVTLWQRIASRFRKPGYTRTLPQRGWHLRFTRKQALLTILISLFLTALMNPSLTWWAGEQVWRCAAGLSNHVSQLVASIWQEDPNTINPSIRPESVPLLTSETPVLESLESRNNSDSILRILSYPWAEIHLVHQESGTRYEFTAPMRQGEPVKAGTYEAIIIRGGSEKLRESFVLKAGSSYELRINLDRGLIQMFGGT